MKRLITISILMIGLLTITRGQTSTNDGLVGEYYSRENKFKGFSRMIIKSDSTFTYNYRYDGTNNCLGEVKGKWKYENKKLFFKNDSHYLNNKEIHYPDLSLTNWIVDELRGIRPESPIDGCLKTNKLHFKSDTTSHGMGVSLISLIANPEKYHNKKIKVIGYMNLEFEGDAIYLHKEDYDRSLLTNAFWVSFSDKLNKEGIYKLNKKYVLIEGTFDMNSHGHMSLFSGEIKDITRIDTWEH